MALNFRNHFPYDWNEEKILDCVSQIVDDPNVVRVPITSRNSWRPIKYILDSECCGINIRVVLELGDRGVLAAYPYTPS